MYKRRKRRRAAVRALAALCCVLAVGGFLRAAPGGAFASAAVVAGSLVASPPDALAAACASLDETAGIAPAAPAEAPQQTPADDAPAQDAGVPGGFFTGVPPQEADVPAPQPEAEPDVPAAVPAAEEEPVPEGMTPIVETFFAQGSGAGYVASGAGTVRNCTSLADSDIAGEMMQALPFAIEPGSAQPQVLIMHTHTTETYELAEHTWCDPAFSARSTDLAVNMAAVGDEIAAQLNAAGIVTLHDTTLHDYPSYNGSYARSNATVRAYLAQYPSIRVVLDVHRDAIQRDDGTRVKPVVTIDGQKAAQVMIICGADRGGNLPAFRQNLRFASRWQDRMESMYPGLTRPVLFDYRYYNQDLTTGSLLIEVGGHANTLEEAKYSGRLVGRALASLLTE